MTTLIVEVDDNKLEMVKGVLKAIGVSVHKRNIQAKNIPNQATVAAIKDARAGKITEAKNVDDLFKSI